VVRTFRDRFNIKLIHRDASDLFLGQLSGVTDPDTIEQITGADAA
jgi:GMP synthase (glutamine-hydrolysing)